MLQKKKKYISKKSYRIFLKLCGKKSYSFSKYSLRGKQSVINFNTINNLFLRYKKGSGYLIRIVSTNRNLFIGVYGSKDKLLFLVNFGSLQKQKQRARIFEKCNILFHSIVSKALYDRFLLKLTNNFIIFFLGPGKIYKFFLKSVVSRFKAVTVIQYLSVPHNGCFNRKKKRR